MACAFDIFFTYFISTLLQNTTQTTLSKVIGNYNEIPIPKVALFMICYREGMHY